MIAGTLEIQMMMGLARLQQDMREVRKIVGDSMESVQSSIEGAKHALELFGVAFTVREITEKIGSVIEGMAKLQDASEKTGASVENLSKLQFFAHVSNANIDSVTLALTRLSRGMADTGLVAAPTTQALKFLGLSAKDAAGNMKDPSALFTEISQKLIQYEDGAGKAAIAQALFGRAGAEILPILKKMAELGDVEATTTKEQAEAAEAYEVQLARLRQQKENLWSTIVSALLPTMTDFINVLLEASQKTDSLGNSAKGLASDHSIERWADAAAMAAAIAIDAFKALPQIFSVIAKEATAAIGFLDVLRRSATLANPVTAAVEIAKGNNPLADLKTSIEAMKLAQTDADAAMQAFLNSEVDGTQRALQAKIDARKNYSQFVEGMDKDDMAMLDAMFGESEQKLKKLNFEIAQTRATPFQKAIGALGGEAAKLQAEIDALSKYADVSEHAREAEVRYQTEKGKYALFSGAEKQALIAEAQAVDVLTVKKNLLTEASKNHQEAAKVELAAQLHVTCGATAAGAYADAIVKLQSGQLKSLSLDQQRKYMIDALSKSIADADLKMAGDAVTTKQSADAIALEIDLLEKNRFAAQYTAAAKQRLANANSLASKSYKDAALAAAEEVDALSKIRDAAQLGISLSDKTKQLNVDMILDDRVRAQAQVKIETDKYQQQIDLAEQAYEALAKVATDADAERLATQRKAIDDAKAALDKYGDAIRDKQAADEFKQLWGTVETLGKSAWDHLANDGKNAFKDIGQTLKTAVLDLLYQITIKRWIIQFGTQAADALGIPGASGAGVTSAGGAGSLLNFLSSGKTIADLFNGNSTVGSIANFLGIGSAAAGAAAGTFGTLGAAGALGTGLGAAGTFGSIGGAGAAFGSAGFGGAIGGAADAAGLLGGGAAAGEAAAFGSAGFGAAASGGAGAALGAIGAALPYVGIAVAVASALGLFGGSKSIPSRMIDSGGLGFTGEGSQFYSRGSQGAMDIASAVSKGLIDAATSLGAKLPSFAIGFGSNTGHNSQEPNFDLSASVGTGTDIANQRNVFHSGEDTGQFNKLDQSTIALRSAQAMLSILKESDLPKYLKDFFDALKPVSDMSADDVSNALAYAQQLKTAHDLLDQIANITGLKATADELIGIFGNIQTATPLLQSYAENFLTAAEKQAYGTKQVDDAMTKLGITTLPKTRAEFRALVEAQDLTTDAGKQMFQSLIAVAPAFAAVTDAIQDTVDALQSMQDQVNRQRDATISAIQDQLQASQSAAQQAHANAQAYRDASRSMQDAIKALRQGDLSTLLPGAKLQEARGNLDEVFQKALSGDKGALGDLPGLAQSFLQASREYNASSDAYVSDFDRVMQMLTQAGVGSDTFAGQMDNQATLLDVQTGLLQDMLNNLQSPDPNTDLLNQQLDILKGVRDILGDSSRNLTTIDSSIRDQTGNVIVGNSMISSQTGEIQALPRLIGQQDLSVHDAALRSTLSVSDPGAQALLGSNGPLAQGTYQVRDAASNLYNINVDSAGRITGVSDALGHQTTQLLAGNYSVTDPKTGDVLRATVDQTGAVSAYLDALEQGTYQVRDTAGNLYNVSVDNAGRITGVRDAVGGQTTQLLAGNYSVTDPATGDVLRATVDQTGRLTSYDQSMLDQAAQLLGSNGPLAAGNYAIQDVSGRIFQATVDANGAVTALQEITRGTNGLIDASNHLTDSQTHDLITASTAVNATTGEVVQGVDETTGRIERQTSTTDAIRNLQARATDVSAAMLQQLAANSTEQTSTFRSMVDGINRTVQAISTLIGLQQELNAADAAKRAADEAAAAKAEQVATNQASLSSAVTQRDTLSTAINTGIQGIYALAAKYGLSPAQLQNSQGQQATFEIRDGQLFSDYNQISYSAGQEGAVASFVNEFWSPGGVYDQTFGKSSQLAALTQQIQTLRDLITSLGATPSHASGLDYVPYDRYLATLHRGEAVLNAQDASEWRAGMRASSGSAMSADYIERLHAAVTATRDAIDRAAANSSRDVRQQTTELGGAFKEGSREMGRVQRNRDNAQKVR